MIGKETLMFQWYCKTT